MPSRPRFRPGLLRVPFRPGIRFPPRLQPLLHPPPARYLTTTPFPTSPNPTDTSPRAASHAALTLLPLSSLTLTRTQHLDPHALQKLSLLLGRPNLHSNPPISVRDAPPPRGTPLPLGYHLIYFTPAQLESELGEDGTDVLFNAPRPFTRRMWAGGRIKWEYEDGEGKGERVLRVGEEVEERSRIVKAEGKKGRDGRGMVVVEVEKVLSVKGGGGRVVDVRSWIFRPPVEAPDTATPVTPVTDSISPYTKSRVWDVPSSDSSSPFTVRHMHWSPVALFGFSGLTYNAHMIHYNESWTRNVEGHPGLVVHGPLNLINMLDYWRDVHGKTEKGLRLKFISYRAMSPIYAGEPYRITSSVLKEGREPRFEVLVKKGDVVCMRGEITAERAESSR